MINITNSLKSIYPTLKSTLTNWSLDNPSRMAAALAYRGVFSMSPILVIVTMVVGFFFGQQAAQEELRVLITEAMGDQAANVILSAISATFDSTRSDRIWATIFSFLVLAYAATGLFNELKGSLNTVWNAPPSATTGIVNTIKSRLVALVMILGLGFFFLALLIINTAISVLVAYFQIDGAVKLLGLVASFGILMLIIALTYKYAPDVTIAWGDVWIGAILTAVLLTLGIWGLGLYLTYSSVGSAYGAAGTLLIILIWIYYSALIFLFGAKFTQSYAVTFGSKLAPVVDEE